MEQIKAKESITAVIRTNKQTEIFYYSSPEEMPVTRFNKFQSFIFQDLDIGNSIEVFNNNCQKLDQFLAIKNFDQALNQRKILQYTFYSSLEKINYSSFAFACLIAKIGNTHCNDLSESGLKATIELLEKTGITQFHVNAIIYAVKKKLVTI